LSILTAPFGGACSLLLALLMTARAPAAPPDLQEGVQNSEVSSRFIAADEARDRRDYTLAERRYRTLIAETEGELRIEARFRLAVMLDSLGRQQEAAAELRAILAENPDAQGIRVILARMLAQSGDREGARREFRRAEDAGLPTDVQAVVRQFVDALRSSKPVGGSFSLSLVADSNVNRATRADTIDTVIAPFQLSEDARAQAGIGANLTGQVYARAYVGSQFRLLARLSSQGDLYDNSRFNDIRGGGQIGLEWATARDRISPGLGRSYRWFGGDRYATTETASLGWRHTAGSNALIDGTIAVGKADYALNDGLDGWVYDLSFRYERAGSARHGASFALSVQRQDAADAGYATASGGLEALYWRQAGQLTLFGSLGLSHLEADSRLLLFARRRTDWLVAGTVGASLSQSLIAGFAPVVRATYTRNSSTLTLYDYSRVRIELSLSHRF
jgi:outer membrane protein